jgi:hypothetical protein
LAELGRWRKKDSIISSEEGIRIAKELGASFVRWPQEENMAAIKELAKVAFEHARERKTLKAKAGRTLSAIWALLHRF